MKLKKLFFNFLNFSPFKYFLFNYTSKELHIMLSINSKSRISHFVPNLKGNAFISDFINFSEVKEVPFLLRFFKRLLKLLSAFLASTNMILI